LLGPGVKRGAPAGCCPFCHNATSSIKQVLFDEAGSFTEDFDPPTVASNSTFFDSFGNFWLNVTAQDDVTSPTYATVWFSIDGGPWTNTPLNSTSDPFQLLSTRSFSGTIGFVPLHSTVKYFLTVQDLVCNLVYFGIGSATQTTIGGSVIPTVFGDPLALFAALTGIVGTATLGIFLIIRVGNKTVHRKSQGRS